MPGSGLEKLHNICAGQKVVYALYKGSLETVNSDFCPLCSPARVLGAQVVGCPVSEEPPGFTLLRWGVQTYLVLSEVYVDSGTSLNQDLFKPVLLCTAFMTLVCT